MKEITNPYTVLFGKEPRQNIHRTALEAQILESFTANIPTNQMYIITGVRGAGKTVFMTDVTRRLRKEKDWVIAELSSEGDILEKLASTLASENTLAQIFQSASINLSFFGLGLEVKGSVPVTNIELALTKMLESLKKKKKRVLITIDEVMSSSYMRAFASAYQLFLRKDLPVFLLMTGLFENINELQNEKNLTFLYRAPKIYLPPLDIREVVADYKENFSLDTDKALEMAKMTKGYPYAFQALGFLTWENDRKLEPAIALKLQQFLEEYVYEIIWQKLSGRDKLLARAIAKSETGKVSDVKELFGADNNHFNPYRKRLIQRGIINGDERGIVKFTLPFFDRFVIEKYEGFSYD